MARPLRIEYPGAWYHVMNRVAGRRIVFEDRGIRALFLELLADLDSRFGVECHAYCLMGNHYHLLLHTPESNLGRAMRHINGLLTQRFNRRTGRDGPLFRGRYKAILVDADSYLLAVSRYIHRNPLDAGLVKRLDRYADSSYPAYLEQVPRPGWLRTDTVLGMLGSRAAVRRYRAFVEQGGADEVTAFYAAARQAPILGSAAFKKRSLGGRRPHPEQPGHKDLRRRPSGAEILAAVSTAWGLPVQALRRTGRGRGKRNLPRAVAMYLSQTRGRQKLAEIARAFGVGHYATVAATIRRLRDTLEGDAVLAKRVAQIEAEWQ